MKRYVKKIFKIECKTPKGSDWSAENEALKKSSYWLQSWTKLRPLPCQVIPGQVRSCQITGTRLENLTGTEVGMVPVQDLLILAVSLDP